jgi:hypothetical protein
MKWRKALLAACMLLVSDCVLAARSDWRQMTVGHFHLYSTMRDSKTRDVARQLQAFEKTVGEVLRTSDGLPDVPTVIYILDSDDFQRYGAGRPGLAGVFYERRYVNVIVINGDLDFDIVKVAVFHEYTHFIQRNSSTSKMPPWFMEGYAELFSGFSMKGDKVTLGEVPAGVRLYMDQWIPMERLLAVKQSDPEYQAERLAPQFYGESWALVHLLLFDNKTLRAPTENYLYNMDIGVLESDAFAQAFPFDKNGLDQALHKLIKDRVIRLMTVTYREGVSVDDAPITAMTPAQADAQMARMALQIGWDQKIAVPLAAAALKENPTDPAVRALSARIAAHAGGTEDIEDLAGALEKGGADDAQLRIDVASTVLSLSQSKFSGDRAFAILDDLVHTGVAPLEAVGLWAEASRRTVVAWPKMVPILESSAARAPHKTDLLRELAYIHERIGEADKARECYDRIMLLSYDPGERLWAQKQEDLARGRR